MANRKEHVVFGMGSSLCLAGLLKMKRQEPPTLPELLGMILGSYSGAISPDLLEPANNPSHRKTFHSVAVLGGVVAATPNIFRFADGQLEIANQKRDDSQNAISIEREQRDSDLLSAWCHEFVSGFCRTFPIGYASHLILDSTTPKSLPLL